MSLHHQRRIADMRGALERGDRDRRRHTSDSSSDRSYQDSRSGSDGSYDSPPTSYSSSPPKKPPQVHYYCDNTGDKDDAELYFHDRPPQDSPKSSVQSLASTVNSEDETVEPLPRYDVPEYTARPHESSAVAATPSDFSQLFPSSRRLTIRHDDATLDGNMNLRIDTDILYDGRKCDMTLFHLRMHDLKTRECSLRRYCRDSGREVCHSSRKHGKAGSDQRPGLQRSLSNALSSMLLKSESRRSNSAMLANLKRNDSGYGSMHSSDWDENDRPRSSGQGSALHDELSANTIKLEFSNYAQVNVKRAGVTNAKRYEFDYWGASYAWKRVSKTERGFKEVSYRLMKNGNDRVLAYIMPIHLTQRQALEERQKGGWIPLCSMWIADDSIIRAQKDLSDVVVASGLMALVDGAIRARFQSSEEKHFLIPVSKSSADVDYISPKRLINDVFNRKEASVAQYGRPSTASRPSTSGTGASQK